MSIAHSAYRSVQSDIADVPRYLYVLRQLIRLNHHASDI